MNTTRFAAAGLTAAAAIVVVGIVLSVQPSPGTRPASANAEAAAGATTKARAAASRATPAPSAKVGDRTTTEVLPPTATPTVPTLPPSAPVQSLLTGSLPASARAKGRVADGFPASLKAMPGSDVHSSSLSSDGGRLQAALDASVTKTPADVIAYYQSVFGALGLTSTPAPAVSGSTAYSFSRGTSSITLTVDPAGMAGSRYVVFATLTPDS